VVFALATLPGSVVGVILARRVSRPTFDVVMGLALCALAVFLLRRRPDAGDPGSGSGSPRQITGRDGHTHRYRAQVGRGALLSVGVGFVSSFLGIGGGVVHVPLLVGVLGFPTHIATATSHFILAFMALVATAVHAVGGTFHDGDGLRRAAALSAGVVVGAQVGAWLSQRLSGRLIGWLLAAGLVLLGGRLILSVAG
jgi:uncharacterized membrane protein YfcA